MADESVAGAKATLPISASTVRTVALCFAVAVLEGFDIQAIGVSAPRLAPEFGLAPNQMGWIFSIGNIGLVIGASIGGWLADRVGRKPVLIGSVMLFGLFTFATSYTHDFTTLFLVRLLTGFGFGATLPNLMAVAAEISAPGKRATTAAAMFCGMPLGGGMCALVTQLLPPGFDWRVLFILGGVVPVLLVPALYFLMPETLARNHARAAGYSSAATALFSEGRTSTTLLLWLTFLPTVLILYLVLNWLPTLVVGIGLDRSVAPQASLAFNFASVAGALLFGGMVDKFGARWPLAFVYGALIVVLIALSAATTLGMILLLSAATGFFLMGANYALYGVAATCYPQHVRGTGCGASIAVGRIGSILGPMLAGLLLGAGVSSAHVVQYLAPVAAMAGMAAFTLSFVRRADPVDAGR
jgi:AAHS family 3-hydroxyphenylpropionic acid transporter